MSAATLFGVLSPEFPLWRADPLPSAQLMFGDRRRVFRGLPQKEGREMQAWGILQTLEDRSDSLSGLPLGPVTASGFWARSVMVQVSSKSGQWREVASE